MIPFNLRIEIKDKPLAIMVEQLEPLTDDEGFMRYQVASFNHRSVICVDTASAFSEDEAFSASEIEIIAAAIREYNDGRKLSFDQMTFDF